MKKKDDDEPASNIDGKDLDPNDLAKIVSQGLGRFSENLERFSNLRKKVQAQLEQGNRRRTTR